MLNNYLEDVIDEATADFLSIVGQVSYDCESPIEALFLVAIAPLMVRDSSYTVTPQAKLGNYRVDFLITFTAVPGISRSVVVECDGHDYHERTKEQAERDKRRDRAIAAQGLPVFRFTGRELHRDPEACVDEVVDFTQGALLDDMNEEFLRRKAAERQGDS